MTQSRDPSQAYSSCCGRRCPAQRTRHRRASLESQIVALVPLKASHAPAQTVLIVSSPAPLFGIYVCAGASACSRSLRLREHRLGLCHGREMTPRTVWRSSAHSSQETAKARELLCATQRRGIVDRFFFHSVGWTA